MSLRINHSRAVTAAGLIITTTLTIGLSPNPAAGAARHTPREFLSLVTQQAGYCVTPDVDTDGDGTAAVVQRACSTQPGRGRFRLVDAPDGMANFFQLQARHSGRCLAVGDSKRAPLAERRCTDGRDQQFTFDQVDATVDGPVMLVKSRHTGLCLSVAAEAPADGKPVSQEDCQREAPVQRITVRSSTIDVRRQRTDFDGDGVAELAALYNYDAERTGIFVFDGLTHETVRNQRVYDSGNGNWGWNRSKSIAGDFDGDGKGEIAIFYDYSNGSTGLSIFDVNDDGTSANRQVWRTPDGTWDWSRSKPVAGDYDGDGTDEIAVFYDYSNGSTGLFVFDNITGAISNHQVLRTPNGTWGWANTAPLSGDYDGDGTDEIAALFNYGNGSSGLFVFTLHPDGTSSNRRTWFTPNGWNAGVATSVSGDYDGDGKDEVAALYNYGGGSAGLFVFENVSGAATNRRTWFTPNGWDASLTTTVSGDYNGDGKDEIAALYNYGGSSTGLFVFDNITGTASNQRTWYTPSGWEWTRTQPVS